MLGLAGKNKLGAREYVALAGKKYCYRSDFLCASYIPYWKTTNACNYIDESGQVSGRILFVLIAYHGVVEYNKRL